VSDNAFGQSGSAEPAPRAGRAGTLFLVGLDGLSPAVIAELTAAGELPNLRRIAQEGCHGDLATLFPTESPIIWSTIATGRLPEGHGVDGFQYYKLFGRRVRARTVRRLKHLGLKLPLRVLERLGLFRRRLLDARDLEAKRLWEIVGDGGGRVGVVNWWNSWPAMPVNGFLISDRLHYWRAVAFGQMTEASRVAWPPELLKELNGLIMPPDRVSVEEVRRFVDLPEEQLREFVEAEFSHHDLRGELKFLISADRTYSQVMERCLERFQGLTLAALYLRGPDIAQHCAFDYMPSADRSQRSPEERRRFGQVVPQAYRQADEMLGRVMARMGPNDTLLTMSDHGFGWQEKRGKYGHTRGAPPGVLYCIGPEFRRGALIENAGVCDIAPTVLRLCGLPAAQDMPGRCLEELFTPEFCRARAPLPRIPTYGPPPPDSGTPDGGESAVEEGVADHLRALGYID